MLGWLRKEKFLNIDVNRFGKSNRGETLPLIRAEQVYRAQRVSDKNLFKWRFDCLKFYLQWYSKIVKLHSLVKIYSQRLEAEQPRQPPPSICGELFRRNATAEDNSSPSGPSHYTLRCVVIYSTYTTFCKRHEAPVVNFPWSIAASISRTTMDNYI